MRFSQRCRSEHARFETASWQAAQNFGILTDPPPVETGRSLKLLVMCSSSALPRFANDTRDRHLWRVLRKRVASLPSSTVDRRNAHVPAMRALAWTTVTASLLLAAYFMVDHALAYVLILALTGVSCLPLILNAGHEGIHGNLSQRNWINQLGASVFYLLGTSTRFWRLRHLASHHTFVNVTGVDLDIGQADIIRLGASTQPVWYHRYQHLYMPLAFMLYTLVWFFVRDFLDLGRKQFGHRVEAHPWTTSVALVLAKAWHCFLLLGVPYVLGAGFLQTLVGFFAFHLAASAATTFVLVSTHVGEGQEVLDGSLEVLPYGWLEHQLRTTADFATDSWLARQVFGGFNHHVAHHLFPDLPHSAYPQVTAELRRFCREHELPYTAHRNVLQCAASHLRRLHHFSLDF